MESDCLLRDGIGMVRRMAAAAFDERPDGLFDAVVPLVRIADGESVVRSRIALRGTETSEALPDRRPAGGARYESL